MPLETVLQWISTYGYAALFGVFAGGIAGLPLPDELVLAGAGYLACTGRLCCLPAILACALGSACGVTISFLLGRGPGLHLVRRHGLRIGLTDELLASAGALVRRRGGCVFFLGYFIPGMRQAVPLAGGMLNTPYRIFFAWSYAGGLAWASIYILAGYTLGREWYAGSMHIQSGLLVVTCSACLPCLLFLRRKWRGRKAAVAPGEKRGVAPAE